MTKLEIRMWNMIGAMGWVESNHNYDQIERLILINYIDRDIDDLRAFVDDRATDLAAKISEYEEEHNLHCGNYSGDDNFDDMITNVIGMGKLAFDTIMGSPARLNEFEPVEGFRYCIPHDLEYAREQMTLGFHQEQAANCMKSLVQDYDKTRLSPVDIETISNLTTRMGALMTGDLITALDGLTKDCELEDRQRLLRDMIDWPANRRSALYAYTLRDAALKLIP